MESRRGFIRNMLGFSAFLIFGSRFKWKKSVLAASSSSSDISSSSARQKKTVNDPAVSVKYCGSYNQDEVYASILSGFGDIGFHVPRGKKVLLKPNILGQNYPDQAATTHPEVIGALCRIFSDNGCSVVIGESSAFYQGGGTEEGFVTSGMSDVAKRYGAKLLAFESTLLRKITSGQVLNPFYITEAVFDHDLVVDVPKLKLHRLARYTGALKNLYGCVPGGAKQLYHKPYQERPDYQEYWAKPLLDIYQAVNPGLIVLDAIVGLDKDGPAANGTPRKTGVLLISQNGAAADIAACRMIGFDPLWVPAVAEAVRRGLADPEHVRIIGELPSVPYDKLPDLVHKKGMAKKLDDYMFDQLIVEPAVSRSACTKCGICIRDCAPHAMSAGKSGFPVRNDAVCIRCYCCEKYCPDGAITLHGGGVNHLIRAVRSVAGI
jgi:uncharacterized protein (DUF362 family)/Pyruvate/2-oxoacid:ferredoxin oxidoreductase delta subunit